MHTSPYLFPNCFHYRLRHVVRRGCSDLRELDRCRAIELTVKTKPQLRIDERD